MEFCWDARSPGPQQTHTTTLARETNISQNRQISSQKALESTIYYLERFQVLICKEHFTAIWNLNTHLQRFHSTTHEIRKKILEQYQNKITARPQDIQLPAPLGLPIQELGTPLSGFECLEEDCGFLTVNLDKLRKHCKQRHMLQWKGDTTELYEKVAVQTFFKQGGLQRYFTVYTPDSDQALAPARQVADIVEQRLAKWKVTLQAHEDEAQTMDAEAAKTDRTGWFLRTGWLEHFAKRNLAHLAHQARLPDTNEAKLKKAAELTEILIERSVKGLSTLARESRRWLKSAKQHEIDPRPLGRLQNPESQAVYASYMVKFVCYFLRILADEQKRIAQLRQRRGNGDSSSDSSSESSDSSSESSDSSSESSDESSDKSSDVDGETRTLTSGPGRSRRQADSSSEGERPRRRGGRRKEVDRMKDARELFRWTDRQKQSAIQLWIALDNSDKNVQIELLLDTLASFIFESYGDMPLESGLIHFLAVLGIDADMGRLRNAKNYSYMLAGMVYCVRVLGVERLLPGAHRKEQGDEDREYFLQMRSKYLADGTYAPMSEITSLLAYGKFIAMNAGNLGNAYWSEDRGIFYLNGRPIIISRFRKMAQDLVTEAETMLWQELLWTAEIKDRVALDLKKIVDDVTFTRRGVSFVEQYSNGLADGLKTMLTVVEQTEQGRRLQRSGGKWDGKQVRRYLRQIDRFLELLMVCVHITAGQPARGSELLTMRHRNGMLQDRNIFVMDGQVMTVIRYHKSQSQWDKPKVVPRFLPPRLGQVMVLYLAYLRPFQEYLTVEVLGGGFHDYVWADEQGAWKTDRLTRVLQRETGKRLGVKLHTLDYRHSAVGIGRVVVGESFGRGYQDEIGEIEEAEVEDEGESVLELQNARTTAMGVGNYGVPINIVKHLSIRSIEAFRPLSTMWHSFLGLQGGSREEESTIDQKRGSKRKQDKREEEEEEEEAGQALVVRPRPGRVQRERDEAVSKAMQRVLGQETVTFRSAEQEQAMHAVLDGQTPLVVVLPTGGGKSLLFTVPACLDETGVTVVVVPYRALIEDLVQRIRSRGIDCMEWKHGETNAAAVVAVSADVAGDITSNGNFVGYANSLSTKGLLRRVVVDECHLVFTSSDWRPKLAALKNLRLLACPIVLLTATLPPVRESELGSSMLVQCATYIRASTVRANTRYLVSWCKQGTAVETAITMCRRQQKRLGEKRQKGVVYCRSKAQCEDMAEALGCKYYHAEVVERTETVEQWLEEGGLIIATSALGTGVDFPGIVFILHVGMPWSMIDYAQESGRGGRAGERVDAVIVVEKGEVEQRMEGQSEDIDVQAMGTFIIGSGCRRGLMSGYLDGKSISCDDIESVGCDRCGEGRAEWMGEQEEVSREWEVVREKLDELRDGCAICWVLRGIGGEAEEGEWRKHRTMQCSQDAEVNVREVEDFRRLVRDGGGGHSCRRCWVSQKYCATGEDIQQRCQWPNIIISVAFAAMAIEKGQKIIEECGFSGVGKEEYARWLGLRYRERVWGEFFSNAMVLGIYIILGLG